MYILGINLSHHASLCLFENEKNIFYLEYDRISGKKEFEFDFSDLIEPLNTVLKTTSHLDHVIFCSFGKHRHFPRCDDYMIDYFKVKLEEYGIGCDNYHFYNEHHLYHASNAFYSSKFEEACALILDGGGVYYNDYLIDMREKESMYYFSGTEYKTIKKHYSSFNIFSNQSPLKINDNTIFSSSLSCGGLFNTYVHICCMESGKIMGLSSYGNSEDIKTEDWFVYDENTESWYTNNQEILKCYREYSNNYDLDPLIQLPYSIFGDILNEESKYKICADLAKKIQEETKNHTIKLIQELLETCDTKNIVLSGGYMLNCVNNYEYLKSFPDINFYIDPISHDGGTVIGACKHLWHHLLGNKKREEPLKNLYLG